MWLESTIWWGMYGMCFLQTALHLNTTLHLPGSSLYLLFPGCWSRLKRFWSPNAGLSWSTDRDRHFQFPNSAAHIIAFYWQHTVTHTVNVTAELKITLNPYVRFNFSLFFYSVVFVISLAPRQLACVSKFVRALACVHVLYVQVCMFVCLSTAVCFFPQSASVVAFLALNAGSPPPVACDIGSWHCRVYSERRRTRSPPETFVLSKRGGVCPSKPLGKLSTALVKLLQTTLKTQPCPQQMFVLRRLCSVALGA